MVVSLRDDFDCVSANNACHCEPVTDVTGVALSKDSLRSQSVPPQAFPHGEGGTAQP